MYDARGECSKPKDVISFVEVGGIQVSVIGEVIYIGSLTDEHR